MNTEQPQGDSAFLPLGRVGLNLSLAPLPYFPMCPDPTCNLPVDLSISHLDEVRALIF